MPKKSSSPRALKSSSGSESSRPTSPHRDFGQSERGESVSRVEITGAFDYKSVEQQFFDNVLRVNYAHTRPLTDLS